MAQDRKPKAWCLPRRVAYIVDHSFPYTSDGYAVRTHEVARALVEAGHDMLVINRPGRPWDIEGFDPTTPVAAQQVIDGVRYLFLPARPNPSDTRRARLRLAEASLMEAFEVFRPGAVVAVSNWENAEPAQYAARRWDVPFFYEQRGFWELSRAAAEPGYETTEEFAQISAAETRVAQAAQGVFTLNRAMRDEMARRGVPAHKIQLVPNGVSTPGPLPKGISRAGLGVSAKHLLGYVGSLGAYEGSADLIPLLAKLRGQGLDVDLMIVGSGVPKGLIGSDEDDPAGARLQAQAQTQGLTDHVHFVPQVPQDQIGAYYSLLDAVLIPRRRTLVTELVSPLKPYAAATFGVPVFMTDMPPLDEIAPDIHASLFPEGDIDALAAMLTETLTKGGHPAVMNSVRAQVHWSHRVAPMSRALGAVAQDHAPLTQTLQLSSAAGGQGAGAGAASDGSAGFDTRVLPRVALRNIAGTERVVSIGPSAHLRGPDSPASPHFTTASRASVLSDLATGSPGRFVIDWLGLQTAPRADFGEWAGLWSIDNMRLNRQIMDACRIARDRGWRIEVTGPVARSQAPLFRTIAGVVQEVTP